MRSPRALADLALTCALGAALPIGALATGCGTRETSTASPTTPDLPWAVAAFPDVRAVTAEDTPARVELGRLLFHDPILSSDRTVACVTCHSQVWGMSDGLAVSVGVGGVGPPGLGRTGPNRTRRNAPTLWNAVYRRALFWDGRVASVEAQVDVPMASAVELALPIDDAVQAIAAVPAYAPLFTAAFAGGGADGATVTADRVRRALGAFVRTITSTDAPYDAYVRGDRAALSAAEVRGLAAFGALGCATCHLPPTFDAPAYAAVFDADAGDAASADAGHEADLGRFEITGDPADRGAFRVPTLRNLRATAPYFHDGRAATIDVAVRTMAASRFTTRPASDAEIADVVAFLTKSLVDRAHEPERPVTVPSGLSVPADGYRIDR